MTTPAPYTPTPFATPAVNPAIGGAGVIYPYVSNSQFKFAPTGVDVENLVVGGAETDSDQALADTIRDASSIADNFVFGADPATKEASLCATINVETGRFRLLNGSLRLITDYKPIIQVNAVDIGPNMGSLSTVGPSVASGIWFGRRTIFVPFNGFSVRTNDSGNPNIAGSGYGGPYSVVWSYVNGYPHTQLTGNITAGTNTCTVQPTDGGTGLLGIIPNQTQLRIVDGAFTEYFTVQSVSGTTITSVTNFVYNHNVPNIPDFIPVTAIPQSVGRAVIFLATALVKTEGDSSLVLAEMSEPKSVRKSAGDVMEDVHWARELLKPYKIRIKRKN